MKKYGVALGTLFILSTAVFAVICDYTGSYYHVDIASALYSPEKIGTTYWAKLDNCKGDFESRLGCYWVEVSSNTKHHFFVVIPKTRLGSSPEFNNVKCYSNAENPTGIGTVTRTDVDIRTGAVIRKIQQTPTLTDISVCFDVNQNNISGTIINLLPAEPGWKSDNIEALF